jgi:hypothetical protein
MAPKDRPKGVAGMTANECQEKIDAKNERELQCQIAAYLNQRDILFLSPTFGKRTRIKSGWPDFTFSWFGQMCCIEAKAGGGALSEEQAKVIDSLRASPNLARVLVATHLDQVRVFLNAVGNRDF